MLRSVLDFLTRNLFLIAISLAILIVVLGAIWLARRLKVWQWVSNKENRVSRIIDGIALVLALAGLITLAIRSDWGSLAPELVSTAVAIAVLDRLFNYRGDQREKSRVISQMGATDSNDVALAALAVARAERWLYDGVLQGVNLQEANLQGANLRDANLQGVNLREANLQGANLRGANLQGANLSYANLQGASLWEVNLQGAKIWYANLQGASLGDANLQGAKLSYANLQGASLGDANLKDANLQGASLQKANLKDANLRDAKYNSRTIWPTDFDPVSAGCILVKA